MLQDADRAFWSAVLTAIRAAVGTGKTVTGRFVDRRMKYQITTTDATGAEVQRTYDLSSRPVQGDVVADFSRSV